MTELAPVLNSGREAATPGGGVDEVFASLQSSESGIDDGGEAGPSAAPRANRGSHSSFGSDDGLLLGGAGPRVGRAGVSLCQKNPAPNVTCSLLPFFIFLFLAPTINDLTILTFIPSTVAGSDAGDAADGGEQPRAKNALERWVENNLDGWTQVGGGVAGMRRPPHTHTNTLARKRASDLPCPPHPDRRPPPLHTDPSGSRSFATSRWPSACSSPPSCFIRLALGALYWVMFHPTPPPPFSPQHTPTHSSFSRW